MLYKIVKGSYDEDGTLRIEKEIIDGNYAMGRDGDVRYYTTGVGSTTGHNSAMGSSSYGSANPMAIRMDKYHYALCGTIVNGVEVYQGDTLIGQYGGHYLEYSDSTGFYFASDNGDIVNLEQIDESDEIFVGYNRYDSPEKKSVDEKAAVEAYCAKKIVIIMNERKESIPSHGLNNTLYCVEEEVSFRSPIEYADVVIISGTKGESCLDRYNAYDVLMGLVIEGDECDKLENAISDKHYLLVEKIMNTVLNRNGEQPIEIIGYIKDTRRHGIFFTEKACNEHIKRMGSNYCNPKCVKVTSEDNQEMEDVLNYLMAMTTGLASLFLIPAPINIRNKS